MLEHAVEALDQLPQFIAAMLRHAHRQRLAAADMGNRMGQVRQRPGDGCADQPRDGHAGQQQHQRDAEDQHEGMAHAIAHLGHGVLLLPRDARHLLRGIGGLFALEGAHVADDFVQRRLAVQHAALGLHQPLSRPFHRVQIGVDAARFSQQAQLAYALQQGLHGAHVAVQCADVQCDIVAQALDVTGGRGEHHFAHADADGVDGQVDFAAGVLDAGRGAHVAVGLRQPVASDGQLQFDGIEFLGQAQVGGSQGGADLFLERRILRLPRRAGAAFGQQAGAQGHQAGGGIEQLARRGQQFCPQCLLGRADVALAASVQMRDGRRQPFAQGRDAETALHGLRFGQRNLHVEDAIAQVGQIAGIFVQALAFQLHLGGRGLGLAVDQADLAARGLGGGLDLRQDLAHLRRLRLVVGLVFQALAHGDAHALECLFEGRMVAGRLRLAMAPQLLADVLGGLDIGDDLVRYLFQLRQVLRLAQLEKIRGHVLHGIAQAQHVRVHRHGPVGQTVHMGFYAFHQQEAGRRHGRHARQQDGGTDDQLGPDFHAWLQGGLEKWARITSRQAPGPPAQSCRRRCGSGKRPSTPGGCRAAASPACRPDRAGRTIRSSGSGARA
ncbi:hypothetical protein D3C87_1036660 [compost metagenome]